MQTNSRRKVNESLKRALAFVLVILSIILSSSLPYTSKISAQEPIGIAVSPPTFEFTANPGDTLENVLKVENLASTDLDIEVDKRDFTAVGDEGAVELIEDGGEYSLSAWIQFDLDRVTIAGNNRVLIPFKVNVPENAGPGGYFASILIRSVPDKQLQQSGAVLAQEVGALILLRIAGEAVEEAEIEKLESKKSFMEYGPVDFELSVKNQGNVHIKPTGVITITNIFGKEVSTIQIDSKNVLPEATRKMSAGWDKKYAFGKYTATASMVYGSQNSVMTATTSFVLFPYKVVAITLVLAGILLTVLYRMRKRFSLAARALMGK